MKFFAWLDRIPMQMIALPAVLLALAPFVPEPHLWQKLKMLADGTLVKPIDIFDLFLHGTPLLLLVIKLLRSRHETR
ncbi:MAG: RND transporter [Candidatus Thiodiazotropha sp.]